MGVCWLDKEETRPGERRQGTRSRGYKSRLGRIPAGQAAEGCDHDPHPAQPVCWSGNLSQHPDFLVSSPPCLGEDPENRANAGRMQIIWPHLLPWVPPPQSRFSPASPGVLHGNPPRLAPDPLVPLGPGNTAQMGGGKN